MKLQQGEEILLQTHPEPVVLAIWFFTKCLPVGIIGLSFSFWFFVGLAVTLELGSEEWLFIIALAKASIAALLALVLAFIYQVSLRRTYTYYITNQRCILTCGIVRKTQHSIPYFNITNVETSQSIFEKILGISTLGIHTPGTRSLAETTIFGTRRPEIAFVGLKDSQTPAETIIQILAEYRKTEQ